MEYKTTKNDGCGMPTMHSLPWIPLISYGVELESSLHAITASLDVSLSFGDIHLREYFNSLFCILWVDRSIMK